MKAVSEQQSAGLFLQSRIGWVLGLLAAGALLAALTVGLNGYRNSPRPDSLPAAAATNAPEEDPLAPRLFDQSGTVRVHVAGAVKRPGVYTLPSYARVIDAVNKARGFADDADRDAINLADRLRDGEQLRIPYRGRAERLQNHAPAAEPPPIPPTVGGRGTGRYPFASLDASAAEAAPEAERVDLNTATREQLDALPGVGPSTAEKIIAHRQEYGPFVQPEDLMNVKGIGPSKFEKLRPLVTAR
jgi:competence protein ComEA